MRLLKLATAFSLAAAFAMPLPASAGKFSSTPPLSDSLVVNVRGCHRDVERHFVPEFGRRAWHFHRGRNCRPVRVDGPGFRPDPGPAFDCHRDARRHFLPEFGRSVVHRHVGSSCRVRVLRRSDGFRPGACVTIGPVTFCD